MCVGRVGGRGPNFLFLKIQVFWDIVRLGNLDAGDSKVWVPSLMAAVEKWVVSGPIRKGSHGVRFREPFTVYFEGV